MLTNIMLLVLHLCALIYNFRKVIVHHRQRKNKGYYTSFTEKIHNRDTAKNILVLFHGTTLPFKKVPFLEGDSNVFTLDIDPTTKPTVVGDATSLKDGDVLDFFPRPYFDTIVVDICKCCVLDSIVKTGIKEFITEIEGLLKENGKLYISGLPLLCKRKDGLKLEHLNRLGLRVYLGADINEASSKSNTDPSYYVFIKDITLPDMTDADNLLN